MKKELILVRHAVAEDRLDFSKTGLPDTKRPLTDKGIHKMERISKWLEGQLESGVDFLCESPLLRSQQTVDILAEDISFKKRLTLSELDPAHPPEKLCKKLDTLKWSRAIVVGHEPHLSHLICFLTGISAKHYAELEMKKGGIASFRIDSALTDRKAKLQWLLTPKVILSF
ncbi:MAG: histidine phosphatase family protein [Bdellovibrionaceae bacterium]|nr:histidine phosphatase family protein [Pseudobdellovibrionaceae bacterium]